MRRTGRKRLTLKQKFLVINIFAIAVPVISLGIISYHIATRVLMEKVSWANLDTITQLAGHIETITNDVAETSLYILQDARLASIDQAADRTSAQYFQQIKQVETMLFQLCTSKSYLDHMLIELNNGERIEKSSGIMREPSVNLSDFYFTDEEKQLLRDEGGRGVWDFKTIAGGRQTSGISYSRHLKNINNQVTGIGYIRIYVYEPALRNMYDAVSNLETGSIYLLDSRGTVISTNDTGMFGQDIGALLELPGEYAQQSGYRTAVIDGKPYLLTYYQFADDPPRGLPWRLISCVPLGDLTQSNNTIFLVTLSSVLSGAAIGFLLTAILSRMIFSRLENIRQVMESVDGGLASVSTGVTGADDEIDWLSSSFNRMTERIQGMMDELYYSEIERQRAELHAIQAQMNPHFLYNTLDAIYWQCRMEQADQAGRLVLAFSSMLRTTLAVGGGTCTLEEEISFTQSYIELVLAARESLFQVSFHTDPSLGKCRVQKMLLQPVVENWIQHAFADGAGGNTGRITIIRQKGDLVYLLEDNGKGADPDYVRQLMQDGEGKKGFALRNINSRLVLAYGTAYRLRFFSTPGKGSKIVIRQPYSREGFVEKQ